MKKNRVLGFLLILILAVVAVCMMASCTVLSSLQKDEDYVEVTGLRTATPNIEMAPLGEYSTFQVDVQIIPSNATNRKLTYYIPTEYLTYVTVSNTGLLTAHKKTDEGLEVPLTVTSTTNSNAKLSITIIVEEVSVQRIKFKQEELDFWYQDEPAEAEVEYIPAHAIDGRSVTYESLNEDVATVETTQDGKAIVTPVNVGQTRIKATSINSDLETAEAFLLVKVDYMKAQYQLHVSGTPQWTQTIGDFSPINFTLYVLGDHIDPNPEIEWFVGGERVLGKSDSRQYTHTPSSQTQLTYKVSVRIQPYKQDAVWLYSDDITVYNMFTGFELDYQNLSSAFTPYQYGDDVTFELEGASSNNTSSYDWYLTKTGGDGTEMLVANTPLSDRNLNCRLNITGDYQLWARAKSEEGNFLSQTLFNFNSERLLVGDTLAVLPKVMEGGLPPESYHWYYLPCDEDGNYDINQKVEIETTPKDQTFFYPLRSAGYFRLLVSSSTNGVLTTVPTDSGKETYWHVGQLIRVYDDDFVLTPEDGDLVDLTTPEAHAFALSSACRISNVVIEGGSYLGDNLLYVHWDPCAGVNRYIVELAFADGTIKILDSAERTSVFGSNFFYIPSDIASFDSQFGIRIKQKDGVFSDYYYYGIPNAQGAGDDNHVLTIKSDKFIYFTNVTENINRYIVTTDELYALVEYILLYRPAQNSLVRKGSATINGVYHNTYTVTFYSMLTAVTQERMQEILNAFATVDVPDELTGELYYMYSLIRGVQQQGPFIADYVLNLSSADDGVFTATFAIPESSSNFRSSQLSAQEHDISSAFWSETPYRAIDITYPIDHKEGVPVYSSDALCYIMEQGYRPVPTGSDELSELYKQIKSVYSSLVGKEMSDLQKTLAFYDWLCYQVSYDVSAEEVGRTQSQVENYLFDSHHLEGVFAQKNSNNRHALSTGYAKAFAALCGLAGIPCRMVMSKTNEYRAYNRVYVNDNWYVVDVTYGATNGNYADHTCFLMSDMAYSSYCMAQEGHSLESYGVYPDANKNYDFYLNSTVNGLPIYLTSNLALEELLNSVHQDGVVAVELECSTSFCATFADLRNRCSLFVLASNKYINRYVDLTEEGGYVRAIILLYDNE